MSADFFPSSPRVLYDRTPLREVICQLRFPALLRVEAQAPADFQDCVRTRFPILERAANPIAQQIPQELLQALGGSVHVTTYTFKTEDGTAHLSLTPESLALTVTDYSQWEDFRQAFIPAIGALVDIYKPAYFSRVGLRYQNVIFRNELGLDGASWAELLRAEVAGELTVPQWEAGTQDARRVIRCKLAETRDAMLFQHGLGKIEGDSETGYMLDFDFYCDEKTEVKDADATLDRLNKYTGQAFRWCIKEPLHAAMGPHEL